MDWPATGYLASGALGSVVTIISHFALKFYNVRSAADLAQVRQAAEVVEQRRGALFEEARQMREDMRKEVLELREKFIVLQTNHLACMTENVMLREQVKEIPVLRAKIAELDSEVTKLRNAQATHA